MKKLFGFILLTPIFVLVWATNLLAGGTFCPPNPGAVTVEGDVIVNAGLCILRDTKVNGDVKVELGGALLIDTSATEIDGDVKCDGCNSAGILAGTIKGDLKIKGTVGGLPGFSTSGHDNTAGPIVIDGDVKYEENFTQLFARGASIGGDLKVLKNTNTTGIGGGPRVEGNTILGDLKCKENVPPPFSPTGNDVDGDKKGQCAEDLGF